MASSNKAVLAQAAKKEIQRRKALEANKLVFDIKQVCFDKQYNFIANTGSRFKTAVCSRRSGKSYGVAASMLHSCNTNSNVICLYITSTKEAARKIIWFDLCKLVKDFNIACKPNNHTLEITFPNGSRIFIEGAKDSSEMEKFRGLKLYKVFIDEMQSMRSHVRPMIEDILIPALRDLRGHVYLTGTPGPIKAGAFYEYSHNDMWENHTWTAFDNPFMHNPEKGLDLNVTLAEERAIKKISEDNPAYRRETYGEWTENSDALVLHFDESKNYYSSILGKNIDYVVGADIGYNDSDAIAVLAVSYDTNEVYIVEEIEKAKRDVTNFIEDLKATIAKYNPIKTVMDAGALGKKIHEEIKRRHGINVEAADKTRKLEHLAFLDADLQRGRIKAKSNSIFSEDCKLVSWDFSNPETPKISTDYHSDIMDAVLYAYRECRHYLENEIANKPRAKTVQEEEDDIEAWEEKQWKLSRDGEDDLEGMRISDIDEYDKWEF